MLPWLGRDTLNEFGTMYTQLLSAVEALPMAAVAAPSYHQGLAQEDEHGPRRRELPSPPSLNADLQGAIDRRYEGMYYT